MSLFAPALDADLFDHAREVLLACARRLRRDSPGVVRESRVARTLAPGARAAYERAARAGGRRASPRSSVPEERAEGRSYAIAAGWCLSPSGEVPPLVEEVLRAAAATVAARRAVLPARVRAWASQREWESDVGIRLGEVYVRAVRRAVTGDG